jgi:hypothetical protein
MDYGSLGFSFERRIGLAPSWLDLPSYDANGCDYSERFKG